MKTLLHNARLIDPASSYDGPGGVLIESDLILDAGAHLASADGISAQNIVDLEGQCLAPGLIDMRVKTGEPGGEHKETLTTASRAGVAGGVTSMVIMPDTMPVIDDVSLVSFIARSNESAAVLNRILPSAAVTIGLEGEKMTEIGLMHQAGACFVTNGNKAISDSGVLRRAMQYASGLGIPIALRPEESKLAGGVMNAGGFAARLGLKGMAREAEWIGLERDLILAEMTGASYIADQITTARSIERLHRARDRGTSAAASVAAHHLFFNELDIGDGSRDEDKAYLTYCKVSPPLRTEEDRLALIAGIANGDINAIVSAHDPQPAEEKRLPFEEASFGAVGLETLLSAALSLYHNHSLELLDILKPLTIGPADILGLPQGRLAKGAPADLIVFDLDRPWKCDNKQLLSRSKNSPFDGRLLTGRTLQTWIAGEKRFDISSGPVDVKGS